MAVGRGVMGEWRERTDLKGIRKVTFVPRNDDLRGLEGWSYECLGAAP